MSQYIIRETTLRLSEEVAEAAREIGTIYCGVTTRGQSTDCRIVFGPCASLEEAGDYCEDEANPAVSVSEDGEIVVTEYLIEKYPDDCSLEQMESKNPEEVLLYQPYEFRCRNGNWELYYLSYHPQQEHHFQA